MQSSSLASFGLECRRPDEKRGSIAKVAARHIAEPWAEDEKIARIAELLWTIRPRFRQRPVTRRNSTAAAWVAAAALPTWEGSSWPAPSIVAETYDFFIG
jgi:hypothetical protein